MAFKFLLSKIAFVKSVHYWVNLSRTLGKQILKIEHMKCSGTLSA